MITETIEVRGVRLDIRHDTYAIEDIQVHDSQDDILPLLDVFLLAELKAILFDGKARIEEPVYEVPTLDNSPTLAEVNARRGYPQGVPA
jgi:hypothetical protein